MGYDIYIVRKGETEEEFNERDDCDEGEYFRANLAAMPVLLDAMEEAGVFPQVDPGLFMYMQGDLVTAQESEFIGKSLAAAPPPGDPRVAKFVDEFRRFCERAAAEGGFRLC